MLAASVLAAEKERQKGPPPKNVRVARVEEKTVSEQITLIGTTQAVAESTVAAEISGIVEAFPVNEGDFVKKGEMLARLRDTDLKLRLKAMIAGREKIRANLLNAEKELKRHSKLKDANSIAASKYDEALYSQRALSQEFRRSQADIEHLQYQIAQKQVLAPFDGFIALEHTEVGQWINAGGPVVVMIDLTRIRITVDVPERYAVMLKPKTRVKLRIRNVSNDFINGQIDAILPQGNAAARTFPLKILTENPDFKIFAGMEAAVTFDLATKKSALLVPKDAVVPDGNSWLVYRVEEETAMPLNVDVKGYYDGSVAVAGRLEPGDHVVIRGNERLRPGQKVQIID
jgi:RND family efflux transporter MFP subunit